MASHSFNSETLDALEQALRDVWLVLTEDFVASPDLKQTMAKAGVMDKPTFYFLGSLNVPKVMHLGWIELLGLHGSDEVDE